MFYLEQSTAAGLMPQQGWLAVQLPLERAGVRGTPSVAWLYTLKSLREQGSMQPPSPLQISIYGANMEALRKS